MMSFYYVFIFPAYRARLHSLPGPEALGAMMPYVSERMRKRRCFADKELEAAMLERERHLESNKRGPTPALEAIPSVYQMAPRDFLRSVFPVVNVNVLELVYQGCGRSLERAVEQIRTQQHAKLIGHPQPLTPPQKQPLSAFTTVVRPTCFAVPPPSLYGHQFLPPVYGVNPPNTFSSTADLLAQRSAFRTQDTETAAIAGLPRANGRTSVAASSTASPPASHSPPGLDSSGGSSPVHSDVSEPVRPLTASKNKTNSLITFSVESIIGK